MGGDSVGNQISKAHSIVGTSKGRPDDDFYPTPEIATIELLKREKFDGVIYEPACGDGAIAKLLPNEKVIASDLYNRGYGTIGIDFLTHDFKEWKCDHIITNPPYRYAQEFVEKSLDLTRGKVAMLLKLQFLEGAKRYEMFRRTPLKTVYVFSKRLTLSRNGVKQKNSGMICFAWFVWEHGYAGTPQIDWILID
jgi:hypothetical protein